MQQKQEIINRLKTNLAEIITSEEFDKLIERVDKGEEVKHYIGFEISGYVHIGQGIMSALVMKDLTDLGIKCHVFLADWHTVLNNKLDGTFEKAQSIARGYFTDAMRAAYRSVGGNEKDLTFILASEAYYKQSPPESGLSWVPYHYWETVLGVAKKMTISRAIRSVSIMGKEAGEDAPLATLLYPAMQVADIFFLEIDIAHSSMDQRKAHVVMRDVAAITEKRPMKPVAIHHALIDSLTGDSKMSKSKPDSAVFIHDEPADIERKIKKAFCEEKNVEKNPILNWTKNILFWNRQNPFVIEREEKHGGNVEFSTYEELEKAFASGEVHPMDLKAAVAKEIIALLQPARDHFAKPEIQSKKSELDKVLQNK